MKPRPRIWSGNNWRWIDEYQDIGGCGIDLAEEALHDAFTAALKRWPVGGVPDNPRAWLVSTGRFKVIDVLRRRARFDRLCAALAASLDAARADLCRRLGRTDDARRSYERALELTRQAPERRFLERRLAELPSFTP